MFRAFARSFLCLTLLAVFSAPSLRAQISPPSQTSALPMGPRDPAELEAFIDGVMAAQKASMNIEGVSVAVVAQGRLLFAKGYGYADRARHKPVDPERTLFRIASVSKLFVWTAVMQLVEQGRLDLKADINTYLSGSKVKVPDAFGKPITLVDLMSHTAGFEDRLIGNFRHSPSCLRPLEQVLASELPARVRPPGQLAAYSNHGTALAAFIVERVSGLPYERYLEEHILQPLQMKRSTLRQPAPEGLKDDLAVGYQFIQGEQKAQGFEYNPAFPAGAMSATATDMAKFMLAHLGRGALGPVRILREETAQQMHSRLFAQHPNINGMLHGFYEMNRNGHRIFGHGGATIWFHTDMALFPESGVGLFVSYNNDAGLAARQAFLKAFIDRYYPASAHSEVFHPQTHLDTLVGSYRSIRLSYTTLEKVGALIREVRVTAGANGRLRILGLGGGPKTWVEVAPRVFQGEDGGSRIAFLTDAQGRVTHMTWDDMPYAAYERIGWRDTLAFNRNFFGASLLLMAVAVLAWPIRAAWKLRNRDERRDWRQNWQWGKVGLGLAALLLLIFAVVLGATLSDSRQAAFGLSRLFQATLLLPPVAAVLVALSLPFLLRAWRKGHGSLGGRVFEGLVALAEIATLLALRHWNLLSLG